MRSVRYKRQPSEGRGDDSREHCHPVENEIKS